MSMATLVASVSTPSTSKPRLAMHAACVMPRYPVPNTVRRGSKLEELGAGGNCFGPLSALEYRQRAGRLERVVRQVDLEEVDAAHVVLDDRAAGGGEPVRLDR